MGTGPRVQPVAAAGLTLAALWIVLHASGVGGWHFQLVGYRLSAPELSAVPAWLSWQAARRSRRAGARRYSTLTGGAWTVMTLASVYGVYRLLATGDAGYTRQYPLVQVCDLVTLLLALAGMLSVPVRDRWSASRLRLGLDMATVMVAGMIFLSYFVVVPGLDAAGTSAFGPLVLFGQTAGVLVVLFAIARLVLGGVADVSRAALLLAAAAGLIDILVGVLQQAARTPSDLHYALAGWALFTGLLTASCQVQLLAALSTPAGGTATATRRPSSLLPYAAVAASFALLIVAMLDGLNRRSWIVLLGALTLTGLVTARQIVTVRDNNRLILRIDTSLHALQRAMTREQLLGDLGTALLSATDAPLVHRLAAEAAAELLTGYAGARAAIISYTSDEPASWAVVATAGADADAIAHTAVPADQVPVELLTSLARGNVITGSTLAGMGVTGLGDPGERPVLLLPLLNGDRFFGVLSAGTDTPLPDDVIKSLATLRTQVSLALDSVALTAELTIRATHDPLTGLGNRAMLRDRLAAAFIRAQRSQRPVAVLLLDLNGFKPVNDTYGHDTGDELLKAIAERLLISARAADTVCRLGGDEFVVVAEDLCITADALSIADRIIATLDQPVAVQGHRLRTPASIGIAVWTTHTGSPDELLRNADTAMYAAKRLGSGAYHVFGNPEPQPARP